MVVSEIIKFLPKLTLMRVIVLMSTFNGEKYIDEQIRSILQQLPPDGHLIIRDDGSSDGTVARIRAFEDVRIELLEGHNTGFATSFLTLLALAPSNAEMVMFSDQDDVWLPEKIQRAWQHLLPHSAQPALYGSAQMLVDESLNPLQPTPPWPRQPSFSNALTENIITGCTAALNQPAMLLLQSAGAPVTIKFHDWWLYLVVSAFGVVTYDNRPTLLYRQHTKNLIGHGAGWWGRQTQMLRFLIKHNWTGILLAQIAAILQHFDGRLNAEQTKLVTDYFRVVGTSAKPRWRLIFGFRRWRQKAIHEPIFRIFLLWHIMQSMFSRK
jgi:glycosyltransferase involved in cell wall biosynthesis